MDALLKHLLAAITFFQIALVIYGEIFTIVTFQNGDSKFTDF